MCGLFGCVCMRSSRRSLIAILCRAAISCRFQSTMRVAVPSSIQPVSRSAPIGEAMIIVDQTTCATFSSSTGGATAHPSLMPGNRLFERLVTKMVCSGMSVASGVRSGDRNP